ncbi:MAG: methyl-accepting chemotaxis protein [Ruminococcus sp.]|jgi:methyl-accepting chemotaxis protein|nr:methyl-accepting chemotaxis protein [Ruminococcus sp.]
MKNMKIGKKLLVGFGIPIGLMVLIAVLVVIMNTMTINNITTVGEQTDLWNYAANSRGDFLNARIQANVLTFENTDATYDTAAGYVKDAIAEAQSAVDLIAKTPSLSSFKQTADDALSSLKSYQSNLDIMKTALDSADDASTEVLNTGSTIGELLSTVFDNRINSLNETNVPTHKDYYNVINDLYTDVDNARLVIRQQLSLYNAAEAVDAQAAVQTALARINEYINVLPASERTTSQNLLDGMNSYAEAFTVYVEAKDDAAQAKADFVVAGNAATESLTTLADQNTAVNANVETANRTATIALLVIAGIVVIAIIITIIMAVNITGAITRPITYVTDILRALGTDGRTDFTDEEWALQRKYAEGKDETAECSRYLGVVANALNGVAGLLTTVAGGDLTISHKAMSDKDKMSSAIVTMVDNLNAMFGEINDASDQVTLGAQQISDASQSLAQGSTEQAATVEELSASIQDVAEKTRRNAERAVNAADLSASIKDNAEKGSHQMSEMTKAVAEINQASQDISKVIKAIDDIAFQTNILALNAAVEAARAGEAGKGFAVVADEVRNLASKSAAAAKETGALIENSIKKAELGSSIAAQTAESLSDIVAGINSSTDLISEIAESSEQQSTAIGQINDGITQVSEVVQKNSATAEECAASSEELNAQANVLAANVAKFKLKRA